MWTLASIESRLLRIALTIIATIGLGAILEWQQTRVPGRFGTVFDVALNAIGALIGLALALLLL
jgi:VanZ family protein